jgi:hypothetical protein
MSKIPLNPPLEKGDFSNSPLFKGGPGGILEDKGLKSHIGKKQVMHP